MGPVALARRMSRFARRWLIGRRLAGWPSYHFTTDYVTFKLSGRSDVILPDLPPAHYDMIYVDGEHLAAAVLLDAALSWRLLKPAGVLIFDDYNWEPARPVFSRPQMAIDIFIETWAPHLELLHREYQVTVRKKVDPGHAA